MRRKRLVDDIQGDKKSAKKSDEFGDNAEDTRPVNKTTVQSGIMTINGSTAPSISRNNGLYINKVEVH
jgi:hypothetical protein